MPPLSSSDLSSSAPLPLSFRHGRRRPLRLAGACLSLLLLAGAAVGCRQATSPAPSGGASSLAKQAERQRLAAARCERQRQELREGLRQLRQAEASLARRQAAGLVPAGPPRPVWDEEKESRYSQEDQQLDRQRYDQELAAWQEAQAGWRERPGVGVAEAQEHLDRQTRALHQRYPTLFTGPHSLEVRPQELARLSRCPATPG